MTESGDAVSSSGRPWFPRGPRPPGLLPAAVLLAVEGLGALSYGVFEATQIRSSRLVVGAGAAVLLVAYGFALLAMARGVARVRRWTRAPVVVTQLIHLPIAWSFRTGSTGWVAVVLGLISLAILVCVFLPSSITALARNPLEEPGSDPDRPDDPGGSRSGR